jgi:uncharacterized protein (DUF1800 family)
MDRRAFLAPKVPFGIAAVTSAPRFQNNSNFDPAPDVRGSRAKITSTLAPWVPSQTEPWDVTRINHLYRRAGFGATPTEVYSAKALVHTSIVDALLSDDHLQPTAMPAKPRHHEEWLTVRPLLGGTVDQQVEQGNRYYYAHNAIRRQWAEAMVQPNVMLREKMVLFWMNHFVVESTKIYYPQTTYRYMEYLRKNASGNFKQMVKDVTIQPAMLIYLDGYISYRGRPNENYGRELLELFTMGVTDKNGQPNYTETDIKEVARSLTGYRLDFTAEGEDTMKAVYDVTWHDASFKQPFGAPKKNYGLASSGANVVDVIDLIFEKRADQIAWYIAKKLYANFIYHSPSTPAELAVVQEIADLLKNSNWEMKPVISAILTSAHFYDTANIGAGIKSPIEYTIGMLRAFGISMNELQAGSVAGYSYALEQLLLDPPNVKGWLGGHTWVSTTTLPLRNTYIATQLLVLKQLAAVGATGYGEMHAPILFDDPALLAWAKGFANFNKTFDAFFAELAAFISPTIPSDKVKTTLILPKLPPNYYEWPSLPETDRIAPLRTMIRELMLLAEYQLN